MLQQEERALLRIRQGDWFALLRVLLGVVWAINVYFQLHPAYLDSFPGNLQAAASGQAAWLAGYILAVSRFVALVGPRAFALFTVVIGGLLALSLITGVLLRAFSWVGIAYTLFIWSTLGSMGAPYGAGATDPGNGIVYAIAFVLILLTRPWEGASLTTPRRAEPNELPPPPRYAAGRVLFGLLWLFDAFWKWHPYFITHFVSFFAEELHEHHAAWVTAWMSFVVSAIQAVGPRLVAVLAALVETAIALSLITGLFMRFMLPIGAAFTLLLWSTAEGFGGPYAEGIGAQPAALLGTAVIYTGVFLYLMAMYRPYRPLLRHAARKRD
jgi:uncharacterized membrane protein YphA (DoxX/SURF4 family)